MKDLFKNAYRRRKVFITGHTGFKGSWLSLWLTELGASVTGYSIGVPTPPNHFEHLNISMNSMIGDILNKKKLYHALEKAKPDIVFHLAAQPIVRRSFLNPAETIETNVMGSVNVLEACRQISCVKAIIVVTSDKCYQNKKTNRGYRESDPLGGDDPYSASKGCTELVVNAYTKSFFNPDDNDHHTLLASVRAGNVIGGGDWAIDRLIPDIMRATKRGEPVILRNPRSTRPWQFVLDPLAGYLQLGEKLLNGNKEFIGGWNFGPKQASSISVNQVLKIAQKYWDRIKYQVDPGKIQWREAKLLMLSSAKANKFLKWFPVWNIEKTLSSTVSWYKKFYIQKQISSHENLLEYINDARSLSIEWTK